MLYDCLLRNMTGAVTGWGVDMAEKRREQALAVDPVLGHVLVHLFGSFLSGPRFLDLPVQKKTLFVQAIYLFLQTMVGEGFNKRKIKLFVLWIMTLYYIPSSLPKATLYKWFHCV